MAKNHVDRYSRLFYFQPVLVSILYGHSFSIFRHSGYQGCIINCQIFIGTRGTIYLDGNRHFDIPFQILGTNVSPRKFPRKEIFAKFTLGDCAQSQINPALIASLRRNFHRLNAILIILQKLILTFWQNSNIIFFPLLIICKKNCNNDCVQLEKKLCNNFSNPFSKILRKRRTVDDIKDSGSVERNEKAKREGRKSLVKEGWKTARSKALERGEERGNKAWRGRSNKHESLSSCYASRGRLSPGHPLKPRLESSRWTTWKTSHVVHLASRLSILA